MEHYRNTTILKSDDFETFAGNTANMGKKFACTSLEVILVPCPTIFEARRESVPADLYFKKCQESV
jgi:hypothetical protein